MGFGHSQEALSSAVQCGNAEFGLPKKAKTYLIILDTVHIFLKYSKR